MVNYLKDLNEFSQALKQYEYVVVDFTAQWCGPCQIIAPQFQELSKQNFPMNIAFYKVDVDDNSEVSIQNNIACMPTFILYHHGKKYKQWEGSNLTGLSNLLIDLSNQFIKNNLVETSI